MSLLARFENRPPGITCEDYIQVEGTKRCRNYGDGGSCSLEKYDKCVEWIKRNVKVVEPVIEFPGDPEPPVQLPPLTDADVSSFIELKVEAEMELPDGKTFWLVPKYTDKPRLELSAKDLKAIDQIVEAFPGAKVSGFTTWGNESQGILP